MNEERKERSSGGRQAKQRLRCGSDLCSSVGRSRRWGSWEGRRVSVGRDELAGEMFMKVVSKQTM